MVSQGYALLLPSNAIDPPTVGNVLRSVGLGSQMKRQVKKDTSSPWKIWMQEKRYLLWTEWA